jgi:hypothetical protein
MSSQRFDIPWIFVSAQLKNSKGDEIFYPVNDDERDRQWARRLKWVVGKHRDLAEDDQEELHVEYRDLAVLSESKEAHERMYY